MKKTLIYAHFDRDCIIRPYVIHSLQSFFDINYTIYFVSSAELKHDELNKISRFTKEISLVDNIGYDFYCWKTVMSVLNLSEHDEIILLNSSVIGPIFPIQEIIAKMNRRDCDFWGITDNREIQYHLQSYFLCFKKKIINHASFPLYWDKIVPFPDRDSAILNHETKLTDYFTRIGFKSDSFIKTSFIRFTSLKFFLKKFIRKQNYTLYYPFELLQLKVPFIKIQLLRENPYSIDLDLYKQLLNELNVDLKLLEDY